MKPILFNTEMVRRLLNGTKTVTRRVVKPQPICCGPNATFKPHGNDFFLSAEKNWLRCRSYGHDPEYSREGSNTFRHWIPPCRPDYILYVLEPWKCRKRPNTSTLGYEVVFKDGSIIKFQFADRKRFDKWQKYWDKPDNQWQSPYFMPREAARIFLLVKDVRVERLQDITDEDAEKEGCNDYTSTACGFADVWDSTIKKVDRARYGWDANPWVWVIEFERISREEAEK